MILPIFDKALNKNNLHHNAHKRHRKEWLRLDNAARIYVSIMGTRSPTAYRFSAVTSENVDPVVLQKALDTIMPRFPYFAMGLHYGFFWNYLQHIDYKPLIEKEHEVPCREFSKKSYLFRVIYHEKRISTEFSHVLTDGLGGLVFTKSLISQYFRLGGCTFDYSDDLPDPSSAPLKEETEDSYEQFYPGKIPSSPTPSRAFHVNGKLLDKGDLTVISGTCKTDELLGKCRKSGVSINDYLSAHYLWALYQARGNSRKDIRLMVPVNLRRMFPSKTLRNFFLTVTTQIRPSLGEYTFDEILKHVNLSVAAGVDNKQMNQQIARNVATVRHPLVRIIPLFIKLLVERWLFIHSGIETSSGLFSNVGPVQLPKSVSDHIDRFICITSPNHIIKHSLCAIGFANNIVITFSSLVESTEIPRLFFTSLRKQGIMIQIESNKDFKETQCPIVQDAE